jgi:signal transduction histidine kinase
MRDLAAQAERDRIAREMHDGLAQVLAYASAKSAAAEELLGAGRPDAAREQMAELGRVARATYVDVRESIVGLASPVSAERGVAAAVETYARQFADTSKLAVEVVVTPEAAAARLASGAEAQAFRVVQEALTNIRKHAGASRVRIAMAVVGGSLEVSVEDDGHGLSADVGGPDDWPHFGLSTMAARAAEAGGTVSWSPRPAGGTTVLLRLPVASTVLRPAVA